MIKKDIQATKIVDEQQRQDALQILRSTYQQEKRWVNDVESQLPVEDLENESVSWFIVYSKGQPTGVLRVFFNPPLQQYREYQITLLDKTVDVEAFLRHNRIAEIGRFAVVPDYRGQHMVVAALMKAAVNETIQRGYSHYITDVFEKDLHTPHGFLTRVMGFIPVATHDVGELQSNQRRTTMILDINEAYHRLKTKGNWVFRFFTAGWDKEMHQHFT